MTDIVERLRAASFRAGPHGIRAPRIDISAKIVSEAANEIERLREALRAFNIMLSNPDYDFAELLEEYSAIVRSALEGKE